MLIYLLAASVLSATTDDQARRLQEFRSEFVEISPGTAEFPQQFQMGRAADGSQLERPVHQVAFGYSFKVAKYEVTQQLWQAVMGSNPSRWKGPRNSVEMLNYDEAIEFCRRVTEQLRELKLIADDEVVRLPSESEWEYVARAGTTTTYSFGDDLKALDEYAWHTGNAAGNDPPVGAKSPNPWGLYDVHGYLWEWCADAAHHDYNGAPNDGSAWATDDNNQRGVLRGGSWKDPADKLTSSHRYFVSRQLRDDAVGLRCVLAKQKE